ncbi:MAG: erythromycin esterase family protein [Gemmatimonadaceae bacterium]
MAAASPRGAEDALRELALPWRGTPADLDPILRLAAGATLILIGEASHGTHEFYRTRCELSKRLITEHGVNAVAVEADWPDAYRVNRFVRLMSDDADAETALSGFERFPQWMWRNTDVLEFIRWLRAHNEGFPATERVGFYGIDLYSLHASMEAVLDYLRAVDPEAAKRAAMRYGCFDRYGDDPQAYGYASTLGLEPSCENEVVSQLLELRRSVGAYANRDGRLPSDALFFAEQNARLVANAERYYRAMFSSHVSSWNLRDQHMAQTLNALTAFLERHGATPKIAVWAHNSHIGDARATEMGLRGELNVGQLVRQQWESRCALIGFTTYDGTVTAADDWGAPAKRKIVRPALQGSYERLFHETQLGDFSLLLRSSRAASARALEPSLERAIGVIYRPETERQSHYFQADLPAQFDAVVHFDKTTAVEPLEWDASWAPDELPETYPTAL